MKTVIGIALLTIGLGILCTLASQSGDPVSVRDWQLYLILAISFVWSLTETVHISKRNYGSKPKMEGPLKLLMAPLFHICAGTLLFAAMLKAANRSPHAIMYLWAIAVYYIITGFAWFTYAYIEKKWDFSQKAKTIELCLQEIALKKGDTSILFMQKKFPVTRLLHEIRQKTSIGNAYVKNFLKKQEKLLDEMRGIQSESPENEHVDRLTIRDVRNFTVAGAWFVFSHNSGDHQYVNQYP